MPKRKRSRDQKESKQPTTKNPFLSLLEHKDGTQAQHDGEIVLENVLVFSDFVSSKRQTDEDAPDGRKSLTFLLELLVEQERRGNPKNQSGNTNNEGSISADEIALLILPWSVKNIILSQSFSSSFSLRNGNDFLVWKAATVALQHLVSAKDPSVQYTLSQVILTQSVLYKFCPKVALFTTVWSSTTTTEESEDGTRSRTGRVVYASVLFKLLTEHLFRPTLDVAVRALLIPLSAQISIIMQEMKSGTTVTTTDEIKSSSSCFTVKSDTLLATLRLLLLLLHSGKGNPRTTFQLFASQENLEALANFYDFFETVDHSKEEGQDMIGKILSEALFHPRHHMDGFYSLLHNKAQDHHLNRDESGGSVVFTVVEETKDSKPKKFRSYQEELFESVYSILGTKREVVEKPEEPRRSTQQQAAGIRMIPVLFGCFVHNSRTWDSSHRDQRKKIESAAAEEEDMSRVQFQLFATWAVPLQFILSSVTGAGNILLHIAPDVVRAALKAMRRMLDLILEHNVYAPSQDNSQGGGNFGFLDTVASHILTVSSPDPELQASLLEDAIPALETLLRLNHLLLHDKANDVFAFCLQDGSGKVTSLVENVFSAFFDSYRMLRQQTFSTNTILIVLDRLCAENKSQQIRFLVLLLREQAVASMIALSVKECPLEQAKEIFDSLDSWIQSKCSNKMEKEFELVIDALGVASELVFLFTRNVRVERSSSLVVAQMSQRFMEGGLFTLEQQISLQGDNASISKLRDITMKICAWLLDLHSRCSFWRGTISPLGIPTGIAALLQSSLLSRSWNESYEHSTLTEGVILLGCHQLRKLHSLIHEQSHLVIEGKKDQATTEGQNLVADAKRLTAQLALAATAQKVDIGCHGWSIVAQSFVFWSQYAEDTHFRDFLNWICNSLFLAALSSNPGRDAEIAKALLSDGSFLEDSRVRSHLMHSALSLSLDFVVKSLNSGVGNRQIVEVLQTPTVSTVFTNLFEPLGKQSIALEGLSEGIVQDTVRDCRRAGQLFLALSRLPLTQDPLVVKETLYVGCKLDFAFRCLAMNEKLASRNEIMTTVNWLRKCLSNVAKSVSESVSGLYAKHHVQLWEDILQTSFSFANNMNRKDIDSFYSYTGDLIDCLVKMLLASESRGECLDGLSQSFGRVVDKHMRSASAHRDTLASLGTTITKIIQRNYQAFAGDEYAMNLCIDRLWTIVQFFLKNGLYGEIGALYLAADLLRFKYQPDLAKALEVQLATYCVETLGSSDKNEETLLRACSCVLGSMSLSTDRSVRKMILDIAIRDGRTDPVLEAAFCRAVQFLSIQELDAVLHAIISTMAEPSSFKSMRTFLLLVQNLGDESQIEALSKFSRQVFTSILSHVGSGQTMTNDSLNTSLTLLDGMVQRRDVFVFRELDLAMTLSSMSSLLAMRDPSNELASSTFELCCTLVTSMHQRYSKVLYACAPSVVLLYGRLFDHAMFGPDEDNADSQRHFTRTCEAMVPHRDVYKKHVVGLVLQFVARGLPKMPLARREALTPAVYFLLDVLSTYETQQLNACMDTQHRTQFRAIYQAYHKVHSYKGQ